MQDIFLSLKSLLKYITPHLLLTAIFAIPSFAFSTTPTNIYDYTVTVVDQRSKEPLIGVSIRNLSQENRGTTTDIEGKAVLKDVGHLDKIEFSYIGYQTIVRQFSEIRSQKGLVTMFEEIKELDLVVVVGRTDQREEEIPYVVERISAKEIAFSNSQTGADVLRDNAGVYVQKSQMGGGSPILRGFESNRVLLVVDGVRMNNAIYRNGHLQNSITLDNSIMEQIEVIYGPGSLMYGSDALGGVVHYRTRDPKVLFSKDVGDYRFNTNAYTRFSTANYERAAHVDLDYATRHWGSLTSITYANYGDLKVGSKRPAGYPDFGKRKFYVKTDENIDYTWSGDPDVQAGTAYDQIDFLQKIKFQPSEQLYFVLNAQYSTSSNIGRYDNLVDTLESADRLKWSEWYYGPQQRMLASLKTRILKNMGIFDKGSIIASFQRIEEDRIKRKYRKTHRTFQLEDVYVYALTGDFEKYLDKSQRNTFSYGFEGSYNKVNSIAGNTNIKTGSVIYNELTRYPSGGSTMQSLAGYATYQWKSRDSTLNFNMGARYSEIRTDINYLRSDSSLIDWPELYYQGIANTNSALTYGAGLTWNSKDNWQFSAAYSTAFRSPNLDDLSKIRPKNSFVTLPNLQLQPEYSTNYEVTLGKQFGNVYNNKGAFFKLSGTVFYTDLKDAIVRELGELPNGDTEIIVESDPHTVQQNKNTGEATIYGFSGNALLNIADRFKIKSGINFTHGRRKYFEDEEGIIIDTLVPMDHIPPLYGQSSIIFETEKFKIEGMIRYNGAKPVDEYTVNYIDYDPECGYIINREGMADNIEFGLINNNPEDCETIYEGLPAWMTYNVYTAYKLTKSLSINFAVENITDVHYRHFGSTISAPGRNFIIALRGNF